MAYNHQQVPFWDFIRSFDQQGAGVDHAQPPNFFGPPPHHPPPHHPPPYHGSGPHHPPPPPGAFGFGFGSPENHRGGFGGFGGFGGPGGWRGPWGGPEGHGPGSCHGGRRGRHCRRDREEKDGEAAGPRNASPDAEGGEGAENTDGEAREGPSDGEGHRGPRGFGRRGHGHGPHARGGWGGWGHHGRRGHPFGGMGGMGGPSQMGAFDLSGLFNALNSHPMGQQPWAQMLRQYAQQAGLTGDATRSGETLVPEDVDAENTFVPPVDVFSTESAYILHIALPGAKKEDVGVNWDAEKGILNVAGVVYRHGDEEFLKTLSQSERRVGVFDRNVKLPPGEEEKEELDGDAISAKMEDGVLVVTVPKVEKEETWTEVKRIDIS